MGGTSGSFGRRRNMGTEQGMEVSPQVLRWACKRFGQDPDQPDPPAWLRRAQAWMRGEERPTYQQLYDFARITSTYTGDLTSGKMPKDELSIPDRRAPDSRAKEPRAQLLDAIYFCEWRQEVCRDYLRKNGMAACGFVGSVRLGEPEEEVAAAMRRRLGIKAAPLPGGPEEQIELLLERADDAGVLVAIEPVDSGGRGSYNPDRFRSIALCDTLAPLILVNSLYPPATQLFAFVHALARLWLGESALSDTTLVAGTLEEEQWCGQVAMEFLGWKDEPGGRGALPMEPEQAPPPRYSDRLVWAIITSVLEGDLTYTKAFSLLRVPGTDSMDALGRRAGMNL